jgi:hypothetical protein
VRRQQPISILAFALFLTAHAATKVTTEIPFEYREGLLWIKASAQQSPATLNLLLDTGAGVSVLNTATAERLKLGFGRAVNVRGVEETLTGHSLKSLLVTANGVRLPAKYLAVDLEKLSKSCASPVDGLLGADFFCDKVVRIDFVAQKLCILPHPSSTNSDDALTLQFRPCGMRVPISVNGRKAQWFRLDTGCASALQWVTSDIRPEECVRKPAIGLTALSIPQTQTAVRIGSHEFQQVPTGLHANPIFQGEAGLLGNGLLSRFSSVTLDGKSGRLILEPRPATP